MGDMDERQVNYGCYQQQKYYQHGNETRLVFIFGHHLYYAPLVNRENIKNVK
jgi:hypothetical protein